MDGSLASGAVHMCEINGLVTVMTNPCEPKHQPVSVQEMLHIDQNLSVQSLIQVGLACWEE